MLRFNQKIFVRHSNEKSQKMPDENFYNHFLINYGTNDESKKSQDESIMMNRGIYASIRQSSTFICNLNRLITLFRAMSIRRMSDKTMSIKRKQLVFFQ